MAVLSYRDSDDIKARVDQAAAQGGVNRTDWLAGVVDRGLLGAGLMSRDEVIERREARISAAEKLRVLGRGVPQP